MSIDDWLKPKLQNLPKEGVPLPLALLVLLDGAPASKGTGIGGRDDRNVTAVTAASARALADALHRRTISANGCTSR